MDGEEIHLVEDAELRRRAEECLKEKTGTANLPGTEEELLKLQHEFQVHQIQLEMQNAELRKARDELETALEEYTDLYDFAPVGYFTLDSKGTISRVNLTGAGLVGVERSRLVGRHFGHFVTVEVRPAFTAFLEKVFTSPAKEACELTFLKEGNGPLFMQVEGVAAESGQDCRIALIDITERRRSDMALRLAKEVAETLRLENEAAKALHLVLEAAEALRMEKEIAESSSRAKSQFLVNMSHELRTPMTGILGMLQLTLEEDLAPVSRSYLETAMRSANTLLRILNDILDMAKFEARKLIIEKKPFSLQKCIAEAADIITPEVRRKGLDIAILGAEEVPNTVVGDEIRVRQVLINLLGNAVKFTDVGKVEVRVTAGGKSSDGKREITFAVTDTGIGIPDDKKNLLFQAFSQVDESLSRKYGGTGLGLTISKEITELMGGTISFVSEEGIGSTFSFTIPLEEAGLECDVLPPAESLSSEAVTSVDDGEKIPRLLLAEDDPVIREVLGLMFKRVNYNLDIADNGLKALEMWEKGGYDLVLMDIQMPQLNGLETTRVIRDKESVHGGHTPIVAMTAHASQKDEERFLAAGMDAYISKPIDFKQCLQVIGDVIRQQALPES
jgi:signal transduction histidine kinase/ActR/RegA family two-component response regulator